MAVKMKRNAAYQHVANAMCVTIHSLDGSALTPEVRDEIDRVITDIARRYKYVVNVTNT